MDSEDSESETETMLWGEIPKGEEPFIPDVSEDIEMAMNNLEIESTSTETTEDVEYVNLDPPDPLITYAITLHKYLNNMPEIIRVAELAIDSGLIPSEDAAIPIPKMPKIKLKHKRNNLNYIPKEFTPFSRGESVEVTELNKAVVRQFLNNIVATLFAHVGFETSHQSVLDVLVDVVDEFFKKITFHLKLAKEDEERDSCGFPHPIERVLTELGFGGMKGLHDYYQTRVIKYITVLQKRCEKLEKYYQTLLISKSPSPTDETNSSVRIKVNDEDDDVIEVDKQQFHFINAEGEIEFSTLETGYQLLNSLEADDNMQNLVRNDDDSSVTIISPGMIYQKHN